MFDTKKLSAILDEKNLTQCELAKAVNCSQAYISRVISGRQAPSLQAAKDISDFLEISVDELLVDNHRKSEAS